MLRIVTLNLNGIRSACRKGFLDWIAAQQADVVCVQEVKAHATDLDDTMRALGRSMGHFHFARQKGYSGVGLYARTDPKSVRSGFGCEEFDDEGRYVEADFGPYTVISVYVPSGSSSPTHTSSPRYQTGIRWPHQSWRETHHGRISLIQSR